MGQVRPHPLTVNIGSLCTLGSTAPPTNGAAAKHAWHSRICRDALLPSRSSAQKRDAHPQGSAHSKGWLVQTRQARIYLRPSPISGPSLPGDRRAQHILSVIRENIRADLTGQANGSANAFSGKFLQGCQRPPQPIPPDLFGLLAVAGHRVANRAICYPLALQQYHNRADLGCADINADLKLRPHHLSNSWTLPFWPVNWVSL